MSVLVRSGCCNKTPQAVELVNSRNLFLTVLEAGRLGPGCRREGLESSMGFLSLSFLFFFFFLFRATPAAHGSLGAYGVPGLGIGSELQL